MNPLSWLQNLSSARFMIVLLTVYLGLALPLLTRWPPPMVDESSFASTARTLLDRGYLGTTLVPGLESHVYWQPPMYFLALAPVLKIGGYCLTTARTFSIIIGCAIFAVVFLLGVRLVDHVVAKVGTLLLVCDPKFVNTAMYARMDSLCMLFMLVSLLLFIQPPFRAPRANSLAAGIPAGLAALTHPLGLLAPLVLSVCMIGEPSIKMTEKLKRTSLFLLPLLAGIVLWGLYILQDVHDFLLQMGFQLGRKDRSLLPMVSGVINHYRWYPLSLAIPCVGLGFVIARALCDRGNMIILAVFQASLLAAAVINFEVPYHVYFAPLGALIAGLLLTRLWGSRRRLARGAGIALGCGILMNAVVVFGYLNIVHHWVLAREADYNQFCNEVASHLPAGARVFGWGSPFLDWGFQAHRPDLQLRDLVPFDSLITNRAVRGIDYVVLTRAFQPEQDKVVLRAWRDSFSRLCSENGRELRAVCVIGVLKRFAFSAEIYRVVPYARGD